jgi:hypothetical protein
MISGDLKMTIADQQQQFSSADVWMREQMFEEDVRAVLAMMRRTAASGSWAGGSTARAGRISA